MARPRRDRRRRAREAALQMLYQWEVGGAGLDEVLQTYPRVSPQALGAAHAAFAEALVRGTVARLAEIDAVLGAHVRNWRMERLATLDRLILRLGVHQLIDCPEVPPPVVIDEAIELARAYSGEAAARFVNGVLDAVRRDLEAPASA